MTPEHNFALTRVTGDAPMGRFMRAHHWIPCALSSTLVADGAPQPVRLLGDDYVAFRASDGRVGLFDEACPHRRASLLLARNENCALTCIFHGWKIDVSGKVVEIPSEGDRSARTAEHMKVNCYPTFEGGGLLWVFLGNGTPPPRPPLPFLDLAPERLFVTRSIAPCNWMQGLEGTIDSVHVGTMHQSWIGGLAANGEALGNTLHSHPRYEVQDTDYGIRAAALRRVGEGGTYVRTTEYVMPFVSLVPGNNSERNGTMFISVPMDDVSHMLFFGLWDEDGPVPPIPAVICKEPRDLNNYALIAGSKANLWGQDRAAMAAGHFTGFPSCLLDEDMVVQASMGAITDRTREQLCGSDVGIARARARLLDALQAMADGRFSPAEAEVVRPADMILPAGGDWRELGGGTGYRDPAAAGTLEPAPTP